MITSRKRMISLRRVAISAVVSVLVAAGIKPAAAQDADQTNDADATPAPSELLKSLAAAPASQMDLGLLAAEMKLFAYFTVNKPDVLKKENFGFLVAEYTDFDGEILVQLSHLSKNSAPDELAAECRENVELEQAALVPALGRIKNSKPANALEESQVCRVVTSMFFRSETTAQFLSREMSQPDDNLCRHIRFYARVSNMEKDVRVHCFKNFFSSDIQITREQDE